jgi:hypothetical protein
LSLFLRLDLNAGEAAHLAHLTTDLLYASKNKNSNEKKQGNGAWTYLGEQMSFVKGFKARRLRLWHIRVGEPLQLAVSRPLSGTNVRNCAAPAWAVAPTPTAQSQHRHTRLARRAPRVG